MLGSGWGSRAIPAVFVAMMAASSASAATVELTSVTGSFKNPLWNVDFYNIKDKTYDQLGANSGKQFIRDDIAGELWWGSSHLSYETTRPLPDRLLDKQSGYVFEGITPPSVFSSTSPSFVFGEFTHYNGAVWTNSATLASVEFWIDIEGRVVDGDQSETFSLSTMFSLFHQETINPAASCAAGGNRPCRDSVTVVGEIASSLPFVIGNVEYSFVLEGMVSSPDGPVTTSFFTAETKQNSAMLRGRLDWTQLPPAAPPVIPLPAAGWLMIAGIGGLAAVARKKRRAA